MTGRAPLLLPEEKPRPVSRLIGEAFGTYIILERGEELVLIDKHAAHERMIYEKLKAQRGEAGSPAASAAHSRDTGKE